MSALAADRTLLIADEPTSSLDVRVIRPSTAVRPYSSLAVSGS